MDFLYRYTIEGSADAPRILLHTIAVTRCTPKGAWLYTGKFVLLTARKKNSPARQSKKLARAFSPARLAMRCYCGPSLTVSQRQEPGSMQTDGPSHPTGSTRA